MYHLHVFLSSQILHFDHCASVRGLRKSSTWGSGLWIIKCNQFGLCCTPRLRHSVSVIRWDLGTSRAISAGKITCLEVKTFHHILVTYAIYRTNNILTRGITMLQFQGGKQNLPVFINVIAVSLAILDLFYGHFEFCIIPTSEITDTSIINNKNYTPVIAGSRIHILIDSLTNP